MNIICKNANCQKPHNGSFGSGQFCSRSCANSRGPMSDEDKEFRRQWAKNNPKGWVLDRSKSGTQKGDKIANRNTKQCKAPNCSNIFETTLARNRIYCSERCRQKNSGGIRSRSYSRGKTGWYKGIYCQSTYELAYLIYCLDNNIEIIRNLESWTYYDPKREKYFKYYPDFLVNGKLVEIKGRKTYVDEIKLSSVNQPIEILYQEDLQYIFDYVQSKTGLSKSKFYYLYEDKEKYTKTCEECLQKYLTHKDNQKFCSQRYAMLANRRLRNFNIGSSSRT